MDKELGKVEMKAIIYTTYGEPKVLELKNVKTPQPKDNEVLIKISSVVVATEDPLQRKGKPYFARLFLGLNKPKKSILGTEFSGEVISTGNNVTLFKKGDNIFGSAGSHFGCYAEYVCLPQDSLIDFKPKNITHEEAAPICSALTAYNFLKTQAKIQEGQKILINGASGSVGSIAVQLAKLYGAEVTAVCSTKNLALVKSLGADIVIDYTINDFTKNNRQYDIIFDVSGKRSFKECKNSLTSNGIYLNTVISFSVLFQTMYTKILSQRKVIFSATGLQNIRKRKANMKEIIAFLEEGKIKTIIDKRYRLEDIIDAHKYVESGVKIGNIVINIA